MITSYNAPVSTIERVLVVLKVGVAVVGVAGAASFWRRMVPACFCTVPRIVHTALHRACDGAHAH